MPKNRFIRINKQTRHITKTVIAIISQFDGLTISTLTTRIFIELFKDLLKKKL